MVVRRHGIDSVRIVAYSLGCKYALATLEVFGSHVNSLIFIAPEGIRTSPWYRLATSTQPGRKLFRSLAESRVAFSRLSLLLRRLGLIDTGTARFAEKHMDTPEKRSRVYYSWMSSRRFTWTEAEIRSLLNSQTRDVTFFLAQHDPVIHWKSVANLIKKLPRAQLEMLDKGHYSVLSKAFEMLA
jgi:pimeloyl-ACP methyl ester carboxylesterase